MGDTTVSSSLASSFIFLVAQMDQSDLHAPTIDKLKDFLLELHKQYSMAVLASIPASRRI
jgi:predicted nuclease of restriction endonuclease-like (RecB) superfamily